MSVSEGGLELNLLRSANRGFVQPVTQTANHFQNLNLPVCQKDNLKQHFAFNLELSPFISVDRTRLECDLSRQGLDDRIGGLGFGLSGDYICVSETALANRAARS